MIHCFVCFRDERLFVRSKRERSRETKVFLHFSQLEQNEKKKNENKSLPPHWHRDRRPY